MTLLKNRIRLIKASKCYRRKLTPALKAWLQDQVSKRSYMLTQAGFFLNSRFDRKDPDCCLLFSVLLDHDAPDGQIYSLVFQKDSIKAPRLYVEGFVNEQNFPENREDWTEWFFEVKIK